MKKSELRELIKEIILQEITKVEESQEERGITPSGQIQTPAQALGRARPRTSAELAWENYGLDRYAAGVAYNGGYTKKDGTFVPVDEQGLVNIVISMLKKKLPNADSEIVDWMKNKTREVYKRQQSFKKGS